MREILSSDLIATMPVKSAAAYRERPRFNQMFLMVNLRREYPHSNKDKALSEILLRRSDQFHWQSLEAFQFLQRQRPELRLRRLSGKDDVYYQMKSAAVMLTKSTTIAADRSFSMTSTLYAIKRGFVGNLESALGEPQAALAGGLVVGDKAALGKDLLNDFRIVGLIHIVVLSGFNITIVGIAMRRLLSRLPRIWGIAIGGIGIALFGILVGGGATVIRSCFMAGIALIADLIRRDYSVERALAFAALIMLIANPLILMHDPSFQLSFLATIGLVLLAGPIEGKLQWIPDKFGMRGTVASCLATQIFVLAMHPLYDGADLDSRRRREYLGLTIHSNNNAGCILDWRSWIHLASHLNRRRLVGSLIAVLRALHRPMVRQTAVRRGLCPAILCLVGRRLLRGVCRRVFVVEEEESFP